MAKFFGEVGYLETEESAPGVFMEKITTREYYGDVLENRSRWNGAEQLNDNVSCENRISILADPYAYQHFAQIRYVVWMGVKWKVSSIDVQQPRLILNIGGEWNGQED